MEDDAPLVTAYVVDRTAAGGRASSVTTKRRPSPASCKARFEALTQRGRRAGTARSFYDRRQRRRRDDLGRRSASTTRGSGSPSGSRSLWPASRPRSYTALADVPEPYRDRLAELVENQGLERGATVRLFPPARAVAARWIGPCWPAFAAIAGLGRAEQHVVFELRARCGLGHGAVRGHDSQRRRRPQHPTVARRRGLSPGTPPTGRAGAAGCATCCRDQLAVWMVCSLVGMALPCMLSLEFIRHAPVSGDRVAAMTAEGMADRYSALQWTAVDRPRCSSAFWCLFPGQILSGDMISRRWTDIIWTSNSRAQKLSGDHVRWIYYGILTTYGLWGLVALTLFDPLQIAKIGTVLMNVALGWSAIHAVYVNRTPAAARICNRTF